MEQNDGKLAEIAKHFFENLKGDNHLQQVLKDYDQDQIQHHPKTFLSHSFGKGSYTTEQISHAHKIININEQQFDSMIDHFIDSLHAEGYGEEDKQKAKEMLSMYKEQIIG